MGYLRFLVSQLRMIFCRHKHITLVYVPFYHGEVLANKCCNCNKIVYKFILSTWEDYQK